MRALWSLFATFLHYYTSCQIIAASKSPEVMFTDVVKNVTCRKLGVFSCTVKTPLGTSQICGQGFVCNERTWCFRWVYGTALPHLFGLDVTQKYCRLMLMDGDSQERDGFESHRLDSWSQSMSAGCSTHGVLFMMVEAKVCTFSSGAPQCAHCLP